MGSKLDEVLARARAEAADKGPSPVTLAAIATIDLQDIQRLFQPPVDIPDTRRIRVVVGGRIDGQDFLNADGIK